MHKYGQAGEPARRAKRQSSHSIFALATIAIIVMGAFALLAFTLAPSTQATPLPAASQAPASQGPIGRPAIRYIRRDGSSITQSDVVKFVQAAGMPRTLGPSGPITDIQASLLTGSKISARLHGEATGFPENTQLWFVTMHGTFVFPGPHGHTVTSHTGYQVFDPISGNIVMFGGIG